MQLATTLSFYKRKDIRDVLVDQAAKKEVAIRFPKGFGKRPDTLAYPADILEVAKKGATSFHCSEELWNNPLSLSTELRKEELDRLRVGWDLLLDIDTPQWVLSKLTAHLFIQALQDHGIRAITCKFSGNKGFHIAVPWESFPSKLGDQETRRMFPELPRKIALYLLHHIAQNMISLTQDKVVVFMNKYQHPLHKLADLLGVKEQALFRTVCRTCKQALKEVKPLYEYLCRSCGRRVVQKERQEYVDCPSCKSVISNPSLLNRRCSCPRPDPVQEFDASILVDVDTILISARHLYRMPYSFHEKSGLVSVPIPPDAVLGFQKASAKPEQVKTAVPFLDREAAKQGEAARLLREAMDFTKTSPSESVRQHQYVYETKDGRQHKANFVDEDQDPLPQQFFPPAITTLLEGVKDGRKRGLLILINFFQSVHWPFAEVARFVREWNQKNPEPLKENYLATQLNYAKRRRKPQLPPNYENKMYYKDIGLPLPEGPFVNMKNPVQHAKLLKRAAPKRRKKTK